MNNMRIVSVLSLSILLMASCSKMENESSDANQNISSETGVGAVTFEAAMPSTKISLGEKDANGIYKGIWETGDAVKVVYIADNSEAGTATVSAEDAGKHIWSFTIDGVNLGAKARVVYPASAGYGATLQLSSEQLQQSAGVSSIGQYSYAVSDVITTSAINSVAFTLKYINAVLKINVSSTEYADYSLKSLGFFSKGSALAGSFTVSDEGVVSAAEAASDKVVVTLSKPSALKNEQTVWMTALPADLTGKKAYVVATLEKDGKELVVPVEFTGKPLEAGKVNVINVELSSAKAVKWYVGDDSREMLGYYAYGPANTVMVEKDYVGSAGSNTYNRSFTINVKARGDFYSVSEPKYYGLLTKSENGNRLLAIKGSDKYSAQPANSVSEDYTIDLQISSGKFYSSTGSWGTVAVYDADYNLLWSFMVCSYNNTDPINDIDCGSYGKVMDRALGQAFSSSLMETEIASLTNKNIATAAYFQWGRKDPFPYAALPASYTNPYVTTGEKLSISESISTPYAVVIQDADKVNWCLTDEADLWGGVSGKKTAFDPCPEGYKVPTTGLMRKIDSNASTDPATGRTIDEGGDLYYSVKNPTATSTTTDRWLYTGLLWCKTESSGWANAATRKEMTGGSGTKLTQYPAYAYWINTASSETNANWISFGWNGKWTSRLASKNTGKARAAAVRCIKE